MRDCVFTFLILYFDLIVVYVFFLIFSLEGPFTLFAPNDAAFAALPKDAYDRLTKDKRMLKSVLQYHVLSGNLFSSEMRNDLMPTTLNMNMKVRVNVYNKVSMYHYWYSLNMHLFALLTPFKICIYWNLYICCCSTKYISWYIHWIYSHITICSRRHVCTPFINAMDPGINLFVKEIHSPVRESNTIENYHRMHNNKRHGN